MTHSFPTRRSSDLSPAFNAGLTVGMNVIAVNGTSFSSERIKQAVANNKGNRGPVALLVRSGDKYRNIELDYSGGLVYPHLEKTGEDEGGIEIGRASCRERVCQYV